MPPAAPERQDIENALIDFISTELVGGRRGDQDSKLNSDDDLLTSGLVDSLGVMRLVRFIEERFDMAVPPADLTIENFLDVATITTYITTSFQTRAAEGDSTAHG